MREFYASDRDFQIRETARLDLEALCYFPEDDASREQVLLLISHEHARKKALGEDYRPTQLSKVVISSIDKRLGQLTICGLVALAMCGLDNAGERMSIEQAVEVVEAFANSTDKMDFIYWNDGNWRTKSRKLVSDPATIKRIFRAHRSVAHICAARIATADYLDEREPFETVQLADACYLSTVLYYQHRLRKAKTFASWNLWEVKYSPPADLRDAPPLTASPEMTQLLFRPWLDARGK